MSKIKFSMHFEMRNNQIDIIYISNGIEEVSFWVSPLFNTLSDLESMKIDLESARKESQIMFYGEPSGMLFIVNIEKNIVNYEIQYYRYAPTKIGGLIDYELWLKGSTTVKRMLHQLNKLFY